MLPANFTSIFYKVSEEFYLTYGICRASKTIEPLYSIYEI
jgi:hypothetical protein